MTHELATELRFTSGWSLGEAGYQAVRAELARIGAQRILEFGSGVSTARLSIDLPKASIFSIEAEARFLQETKALLQDHGGPADVDVIYRPLTWQRRDLAYFYSFSRGPLPAAVDAILIDGPPIATRRGREECLYQGFERLRVGGLVFLDDYARTAEQQIVCNWLRAYGPALEFRKVLESEHRICVLEKTAHSPRRRSLRNFADVWLQTLRLVAGRVRARTRTGLRRGATP